MNEKRMVETYEIQHAIQLGDKEVLFGIDRVNAETPYMVCNCTSDNPFGVDQYFYAVGGDDYLEMMSEFLTRVAAQLEAVKAEREAMPIPLQPLTAEQCMPNDYSESIEGKVVAIRPERLRPEYRTANNQLVLVTGGFGAFANARGRAVYIITLYSGQEARWNREDILGVVKPDCLPQWAQEKLGQIQAQLPAEKRRNVPER